MICNCTAVLLIMISGTVEQDRLPLFVAFICLHFSLKSLHVKDISDIRSHAVFRRFEWERVYHAETRVMEFSLWKPISDWDLEALLSHAAVNLNLLFQQRHLSDMKGGRLKLESCVRKRRNEPRWCTWDIWGPLFTRKWRWQRGPKIRSWP